jgi:hypothetical protein
MSVPLARPALIRAARRLSVCAASIAAFALTGCIVDIASPEFGDGTSHGGTAGTNTPSVDVGTQSFGFAVLARRFTFDREYATVMPTSNARLSVAIAQYGGGSALLEVRDATNSVVFSRQFTGNVAENAGVVQGTPPLRVRVSFSGFSGSFAASLAGTGP